MRRRWTSYPCNRPLLLAEQSGGARAGATVAVARGTDDEQSGAAPPMFSVKRNASDARMKYRRASSPPSCALSPYVHKGVFSWEGHEAENVEGMKARNVESLMRAAHGRRAWAAACPELGGGYPLWGSAAGSLRPIDMRAARSAPVIAASSMTSCARATASHSPCADGAARDRRSRHRRTMTQASGPG